MMQQKDKALFVDVQAAAKIQANMPEPALLDAAAAFCRAVSDPTRMRILCALAQCEVCVGDLAASLSMSKSAVSHQLRLLRGEGLVRTRRAGKNIYYALDDQHVVDILNTTIAHVKHKKGL